MNQALAFGALGVGGILLVKSVTGSSFSDIVQGHPGTVSSTGGSLLTSGVAGAGAAVSGGVNRILAGGSASSNNSSVARQLMSEFQSAGLSKAGAAAIVGNWQQESGLNPSEQGGYLAQWLGSRLANLESFAAAHGASVTSTSTQAAFALHELETQYPGLLHELQTTTDPAQAAVDVSNQYERPAAWAANNSARARYAVAAYNGNL